MTSTLHIYTRVSSVAQQDEGTSLEAQKQLGVKKAEELGVDYHLWNEGGQSSFYDDLDNRPVLVGLLAQIESGQVKHLFVYNTDRLSRNQKTWAVIRFKLLAHGVTLHTVSGQMKLKNPVDDLMLGILSEISQYDNRIRTERSRMGRFHKVQQGNWKGGHPPYGYRLTNKRLDIDPFESEWVRKIYDWYCQGVSIKEIQSRLARQGVMTRRGNAQWSLGSIQLVLRNPVYIGHFEYTDKMIGETVRLESPQIVDSHLFEIAQRRRVANREHKHSVEPKKHFYLLRGLLICGHCGTPMGGRIYRQGHQNLYYCVKKELSWKMREPDHPKWKRGVGCSMVRSINIQRTDRLVWDVVKTTLQQVREQPPSQSELVGTQIEDLESSDGSLSESVTWMSPEQIDILAGVGRKNFLNSQIASIHVYFDAGTAKHRLSVKFSEGISRVLAARKGCQAGTWGPEDPVRALGSLPGPDVGPGFGTGPGNPPLGEVGPGIGRAGLFGHGGVMLRHRP